MNNIDQTAAHVQVEEVFVSSRRPGFGGIQFDPIFHFFSGKPECNNLIGFRIDDECQNWDEPGKKRSAADSRKESSKVQPKGSSR